MASNELCISVASIAVLLMPGAARAAVWNTGDLAIAVSGGCYQIRDNTGVLKDTICNGGSGFTAGCSWDNERNKLYTTDFTALEVVVYDDLDPHAIQQVLRTGGGLPLSIVFDGAGNFYVGPLLSPVLQKYDATAALVASFNLAIDAGIISIDLSSNQATMFYTSLSNLVRRFDVAAPIQLPDFGSLRTLGGAAGLRLLPPGDGTGGLVVANEVDVSLLDGAGNVVRTDALGGRCLFGLDLDPNGTSYWVADFCISNVYKVDLATGAVETSFNTGTDPGGIFGICVKKPTAATPFAAFQAEVEVRTSRIRSEAEGQFTLGDASNGIDPSAEHVTFQIGSFSGSIPKASFRADPSTGAFNFDGLIGGTPVEAVIAPVLATARTFHFEIELKGVDAGAGANAVIVQLAIGNDNGTTSAPVESRAR